MTGSTRDASRPAVLVTGGAGYIGSHTCKLLAREGFLPIAYDSLVRGHAEAVCWGPLERGDLADRARLRTALERHRPVAVMHFAAYAYVGESVLRPGAYYGNNVSGTLALLEAVHEFGIDAVVFSSSCATYGVPRHVPVAETHPQDPISPYGASKAMGERILRDFGRAHGTRYAILRYFNAAGADPDGEIGEDHEPETHLIPLAIQAASGRRTHVEVFGTDYPTEDGTAVRDYVHVTDLARAHVQALRHLRTRGASIELNLGTGRGHSVREVLRTVESVSGRSVPVREGPRRPGDPPALIADPTRAESVLGWRAQHPDIRTIVQTAWAWHRGRIAPERSA